MKKWLTLKADDLPTARKERDTLTQMLKDGIDPNFEIKLKKERIRKQQLDEQEALAKLAARVTVTDLFSRWRDTDVCGRRAERAYHANYRQSKFVGDYRRL